MRTFTKSLVTLLLLLVVGSLSAQSLKVLDPNGERDWSKQADGDYPYYFDDSWLPSDAFKEVANGALHIYNPEVQEANYNLQLFVLDWFNTTEGEEYAIRIWMKADGAGTANLVVGTWGGSASSTFDFEQSDDFKMYQIAHIAAVTSTGNDEHIIFQCGTFAGNIEIQKIQILQMGEDKPVLSTYGTWIPLINNSDMEGDDVSNFFAKINRDDTQPVPNAKIIDGVGVDGGRGIMVAATDIVEYSWDNQFWFRFNEPLEENTNYRVQFNYRADLSGSISTQAHAEPGDYIHYELFGNIYFEDYWQTFQGGGTVTGSQSGSGRFQSAAFNLSDIAEANNYYFDNIYFDVYEPQIDVQYGEGGCIKVLFPYYTNTCRLMMQYAGGKKRLHLPNEMFTVTVNGKTAEFESVEIDATGNLYVFISEEWAMDNDCEYLDEEDKVIVTFNNPDSDFHLYNIDTDESVENFSLQGRFVEDLYELPDIYNAPYLLSSDPEDGSFNLPNTISEFKFTFNKKVIVKNIVAKLDNESLTVEAKGEFSDEVTLKRNSAKALADGEHKITVTKIYGEYNLGEIDFSSCEVNFIVGAQVSQDLLDAIAVAQTVLEGASDARYAGTAYTSLDNAITRYETEASTYTAQSVINAAMNDLINLSKALNTHKTLVDDYDTANQKIQDLATDLAESKFNGTDLYQQLKALAEKYAGKELTDDEELTAANNELKPMADLCANMFTEGISNNGDAGFKVLTERIRRGVEALKNLGYDEEDPLIVAANNLISDDDNIADQIKVALTKKVYEGMKDPEEFFPVLDIEEDEDGNLTEVKQTYDMSVFIKNPNMYAKLPKNGWSEENMPGWGVVKGNPGFWGNGGNGWGNPRNIEGVPEDIVVTVYHSEAQVEQTITGLPAGIYTVTLYGTDWGNQKGDYDEETGEWSGKDALGFVYAKTSDTPEPAEGEELDRDLNFAATATIEAAMNHGLSQYSMDLGHNLENITVTDGKLTIGFYYGNDSQYFFGDVKLTLVAPANGFDYAKAYNEMQGIVEEEHNSLYIADGQRFSKTKTNVLPISLKNEDDILGFQFDVVLPKGMTLALDDEDDYSVSGENVRAKNHSLSCNVLGDGTIRIVGTNLSNKKIASGDGILLNVGVNVASWVENGDYVIRLKEVKFTNTARETVPCSDKSFMVTVGGKLGDVNHDEAVDVTDAVLIIDHILMKYPSNFDASLADVNGDSYIDVTDVVMVIDAILGKIELARGAEMIDRSAYTAFQMDLTIPAGYVLESVSLTDIAKDSHSLAYNMLADGRCRVVVCSMNNEALPGAWDEVISLNLRGKGNAQVNIERAVFVTIDGERHELMLNPTSIAEISNLKSQTSNLYDLQGRKIEKSVKGILIKNGKKSVCK